MELFEAIMFRRDNTEGCYSQAMLDIFNKALADRIAHLNEDDEDMAWQIAKSFADEVNDYPVGFDDPPWLRRTLSPPQKP